MKLMDNADCTTTSGGEFYASTGPTGWSNGVDCLPLTNSTLASITPLKWTGLVEANYINDTFGLHYEGGGKGAPSLHVGLICDTTNSDKDYVQEGTLTYDPLTNSFSTWNKSKRNCSIYENSEFIQFLVDYWYIWGGVCILIGLFFALFGKSLFSVTLFLVGMCVTTALLLVLCYTTFLKESTKDWLFWTMVVCSAIIGLAAGFLLYKCQKLGASILAGWGGFMGGILLNTTFAFAGQGSTVFWIITCSCALVASLVALVAYNPVVIIMTSFMGSYIFIRGISLYTGGYVSEYQVLQLV
jgi:hypothetical protein